MISAKIDGLKELEEALGKLPEELGEKVLQRTLFAAAGSLKKEAAAKAPQGQLPHWVGRKAKGLRVEPGNLRKAIRLRRMRKVDRGAAIEMYVAKRAFYAYFWEFGTSKMRAKPFLAPTFDNRKEEVAGRIKDLLGQQIDKAVKKLSQGGA